MGGDKAVRRERAHLVVGAGPCGHLYSVHNLLDVDHLKHGEEIPDADPHIANNREVDVMERVNSHSGKDPCLAASVSSKQQLTLTRAGK